MDLLPFIAYALQRPFQEYATVENIAAQPPLSGPGLASILFLFLLMWGFFYFCAWAWFKLISA